MYMYQQKVSDILLSGWIDKKFDKTSDKYILGTMVIIELYLLQLKWSQFY